MLPIDKLPTLADSQAVPRATPKPNTRLDRAIAKKAARLMDEKLLRKWALDVKTRDRWKDRKTGQRVTRTLSLNPDRAEAHHVVSRDDHAVRYDIRNGICVSALTHDALTRGQLAIEGTAWFRKGGVKYIDATAPVYFVRL